MSNRFPCWNQSAINELQKKRPNLIVATLPDHQQQNKIPEGKIVSKHFKQRSKEKDFIAWNLWYFCHSNNIQLRQEFKFNPERLWRFDWAIPALKIAVEYEGIFSEKSGHTTLGGYSKDTEKYNSATALGWKVFRFTAKTYLSLMDQLRKATTLLP